jgi:methylthioribose-1-phosphate isomerase
MTPLSPGPSSGLSSGPSLRTVDWAGDHLVVIDQTLLPDRLVLAELHTIDAVIDALQRLVVRGAPAIGVTGGLGVALATVIARRDGHDLAWVRASGAIHTLLGAPEPDDLSGRSTKAQEVDIPVGEFRR